MTKVVTLRPRDMITRLQRREEIAFLDLREAGPFSEGHPLFAVPVPWSMFELEVGRLVPRLGTPVVLIDGGDGIAESGANALLRMGYQDVALIGGGAPGWQAAGGTLFEGVNVPSKVLGELAEERFHPASIDVTTLTGWLHEEGRDIAFYDCRPSEEFRRVTVPGAKSLPIGEMLHHLPVLPKDIPLVLTCAGRTRGLIGALSIALMDDREVYALENGTQGWQLAGRTLSRNNQLSAKPELDRQQLAMTRQCAEGFLADHSIAVVDTEAIRAMLADETRSCLLFDVRGDDTPSKDLLPAFTSVSCGQLVQATDRWVGVRGARIVLADDAGMRAGYAAYWLRCLGYQPYVAYIDDSLRTLPQMRVPELDIDSLPVIEPGDALEVAAAGKMQMLDLRPSALYAMGHVDKARWASRMEFRQWLDQGILLVGDDRARLFGADLRRCGNRNVMLVDGGHDALVLAGAEVKSAASMPLSRAIDIVSFAYGRHEGDLDASRRYLDWEQGLVARLQSYERALFRLE